MARKRYKPEEIVSMRRQAEVLRGQGMSMADAMVHLSSRSRRRAGTGRDTDVRRPGVRRRGSECQADSDVDCR